MNSKSTKSKNLSPVYILLAVLAMFGGLFIGFKMSGNLAPAKPPVINGTILPQGRLIAPFHLVDYDNKAFGPEQLKDQWTFMFFGYTNCPDVCPSTMFQFNLVANELKKTPEILANTKFVLVSVDPERDTPELLKQYLGYYNKDFIGVTGSQEEIKKFTRGLGILYAKSEPEEGKDNYLVDHSAAILLTNNEGNLYAIFSAPHEAIKIAQDYVKARKYFEELK
jgi:protein SCO1/2